MGGDGLAGSWPGPGVLKVLPLQHLQLEGVRGANVASVVQPESRWQRVQSSPS
jgi:hypothetical protein